MNSPTSFLINTDRQLSFKQRISNGATLVVCTSLTLYIISSLKNGYFFTRNRRNKMPPTTSISFQTFAVEWCISRFILVRSLPRFEIDV